MSRWIDADALHKAYIELRNFKQDPQSGDWISLRAVPLTTVIRMLNDLPSIDLDDYVPKEFHDKTCEAMAQRHQEEIANMVSVVRCKECAHWDVPGVCFEFMTEDENGFCSWAERRE